MTGLQDPCHVRKSAVHCRLSASLERASRGPLSQVTSAARQAVLDSIQCIICQDVVQLPVSIICFSGCPGTHARGAWWRRQTPGCLPASALTPAAAHAARPCSQQYLLEGCAVPALCQRRAAAQPPGIRALLRGEGPCTLHDMPPHSCGFQAAHASQGLCCKPCFDGCDGRGGHWCNVSTSSLCLVATG